MVITFFGSSLEDEVVPLLVVPLDEVPPEDVVTEEVVVSDEVGVCSLLNKESEMLLFVAHPSSAKETIKEKIILLFI